MVPRETTEEKKRKDYSSSSFSQGTKEGKDYGRVRKRSRGEKGNLPSFTGQEGSQNKKGILTE